MSLRSLYREWREEGGESGGVGGRGGPSARRMDEADGASRAGRRQAVRTCGPFTLRTSHGLSPPQWATAAKQAKCRQTFGSAWVPYIRPPGAGQFEQGGGRELAGVGARGWTCGQLSLLETAFPGPLRCGDFQNSPTQDGSVRGRAGSGFRMSECLHRTPEGQPQPHASTLRWQSEDKSHREGVPATKRSHPPLAPGLTSPPWLSPRPGVCTAGGQGGPTTRKAFLELSTPEATGLAKGRERKSNSDLGS